MIITITQRKKSIDIDTSDIIYLQAENKVCHIAVQSGYYTIAQSLTSLTEQLPDSDFFRIHRTATINMRYIKAFSRTGVTLVNGLTLPLSRNNYHTFLETFAQYISKERQEQIKGLDK